MKEQDKLRFAQILTGLAELYGKEFSRVTMGLWFEALKDYDIEAISAAVSAHVKSPDTGQYLPKPADVVKMIAGTSKESSHIAWTKVDKAVRQVGVNQTVVFDDPLIHRVISDMGGWVALGDKTEDEWPFVANEFQNRYLGYKSRNVSAEYPPKLLGLHDAQNDGIYDASWYKERGLQQPPPVLIGDASAARQVLAGGSTRPAIEFTKASEAAALPEPRKAAA